MCFPKSEKKFQNTQYVFLKINKNFLDTQYVFLKKIKIYMENKEYIEKIKNKIKQIYNLGCYK